MDVLFGIDLGTTYSCVAYVNESGQAEAIKNADGVFTTPSVIYFDSETSQIVGDEAKEYAVTEPEKSVAFIKREMGTQYRRKIMGEEYSPQELSSKILKKLVQDANNTLQELGVLESGQEVKKVVITCPAYFGMAEKDATKVAGELAGLEVLDIINEPTAAAIHYGQLKGSKGARRVLVYDLGGGTFDVTIMDIDDNNVKVLCTGGDARLGGKDWDEATVRFLMEKWQSENDSDEDITINLETKAAMLSAAEKAKKTLTNKEVAKVNFIHDGENFRTELTREEFDEYTAVLLNKTLQMTDAVIDSMKAKDSSKDIDEIILVGGSSRMPQVERKIAEVYQKPVSMFDPNEAVAKGAAIYAQGINDYKIWVSEEAEKSGASIDVIEQEVACGRRRYDSNGGGMRKLNISNVSSRTYGTDYNDEMGKECIANFIFENDELPKSDTQVFSTMGNNQQGTLFKIYETVLKEQYVTDSELVKSFTPVAVFEMKFKAPVPVGTLIETTLTLGNDGLLKIFAEEKYRHSQLNCEYKIAGGLESNELAKARVRSEKSTVE